MGNHFQFEIRRKRKHEMIAEAAQKVKTLKIVHTYDEESDVLQLTKYQWGYRVDRYVEIPDANTAIRPNVLTLGYEIVRDAVPKGSDWGL